MEDHLQYNLQLQAQQQAALVNKSESPAASLTHTTPQPQQNSGLNNVLNREQVQSM